MTGPALVVPGRIYGGNSLVVKGMEPAFFREVAVEGDTSGEFRMKNRDQNIRAFRGGNVVFHPE
jgi:hypothetical protein